MPHRLDPRTQRLNDAVAAYRARLEPRIKSPASPHKATYEECDSLLQRAQQSVDGSGSLNQGWALVHEAERVEIGALDGPQLKARAIALRNEADDKLREWRRKAALELLGDDGGKNPPTADELREALRIRNEHFENLYYKIKVARLQLLVLGSALLVTLLIFLLVLWRSGSRIGDLGWLEFVRVMLAGGLGGALSAVRSVGSGQRKIPDQLADWPITAMRPLLGAAAGTGAALLLAAGILDFGKEEYRDAALMAAAFVAGFSERWFLGLIGGVSKSE